MKKTILILLFALLVIGCERSIILESEEGKMVNVSLTFAGEVTVEDSSIEGQTRAGETESKNLIGIQVYQNGSPYAYGLFDDVSNVSIFLNSDKKYKFICSEIKPGKSLLKKMTVQAGYNNVSYGDHKFWCAYGSGSSRVVIGPSTGYGYPFNVQNTTYSVEMLSSPDNKFNYTSDSYFKSLSGGECSLSASESRVYYPKLYRYYGEVSNYIPSANGTVSINMKHTTFGLKYIVTGVTDGSASITIKNDGRTFFSKSDISSSFTSDERYFQFEDVKSAWQYADDYSENVTVSMSWLRGVGVNQDLGSQVVQVKRNKLNLINISLNTSTRSSDSVALEQPDLKIEVYNE